MVQNWLERPQNLIKDCLPISSVHFSSHQSWISCCRKVTKGNVFTGICILWRNTQWLSWGAWRKLGRGVSIKGKVRRWGVSLFSLVPPMLLNFYPDPQINLSVAQNSFAQCCMLLTIWTMETLICSFPSQFPSNKAPVLLSDGFYSEQSPSGGAEESPWTRSSNPRMVWEREGPWIPFENCITVKVSLAPPLWPL